MNNYSNTEYKNTVKHNKGSVVLLGMTVAVVSTCLILLTHLI